MPNQSDALMASLIAARDEASKPVQRDWTTTVFVSLYLVLLAFFLVLNALSTKEENKVRLVLESIDAKFRGPFYVDSGVIDVKHRNGVIRIKNDALDDIGVLLRGIAIIAGGTGEQDGDVLHVTVSTHKLFPPRAATVRAKQSGLLESLADILQKGDSGDPIDTSIVVGTGPRLPETGASEAVLAAKRAAALSMALTSRGVATSTVSAGLGTGDATMTVLTFKRRRAPASDQGTR